MQVDQKLAVGAGLARITSGIHNDGAQGGRLKTPEYCYVAVLKVAGPTHVENQQQKG